MTSYEQIIQPGQVEFIRQIKPLPDGRVRVTIQCRQESRLIGNVTQVRGGWQFRSIGGKAGEVYKMAAECKKAIASQSAGMAESSAVRHEKVDKPDQHNQGNHDSGYGRDRRWQGNQSQNPPNH